ncbi:unnamed protein product [Heterotrigona itama]|uniref:Uncharacterized protein n=1 Tax=Heterotrigona itama TaxID=395501 RepID=A0A6V7H9M5_9HYME|nr:unnamed protein product [Heterotrigona itama]
MDFNVHGNVYADEQRDRSEESQWNTQPDGREVEKIQRWTNERQKKQGIGPVRSNESARDDGERDFHRNQRYRRLPANHQGENYGEMCEHGRGSSSYQGNCPDRNACDFTGQNILEHIGQLEPRCENYGRDAIDCDASTSNDPCLNRNSGINVSVVSRQPPCHENFHIEKPTYNVSFKHCYDNNNSKPDQKRRKSFSANNGKPRRSRKQEPSRYSAAQEQKAFNLTCEQTLVGHPSNFRCTFENCCGNCEPYVVRMQSNDCSSYEKWQNDGSPKNGCLDDCCCPRDVKPYSSSVSVPQQSCVIYEETEANCDDRHASTSKHCLQRVHFAKAESRAKTDHSSCSFCSRKCTPSKASLFVEIGESVADVCNLTSARCDESTEELLKGDASRKESRTARGSKFESSRGRSGSKRNEPTRCSSSCKGQPDAVGRAYSNSMDVQLDDYTVEQMLEEPYCPELLAQSNVSFHELRDSRAQTEDDMYVKRKTTGCSQQCETNEHSLLNDFRRQLQDTYKNFVRMATTSIGQIVKQSSKLKRSKKNVRDRSTCGTCTKDCEETARPDQCDQSETHNECMYEATCWREIMNHESNNCDTHCCGNVCCDNDAGLPDCQMCRNDCWKRTRNAAEEQIQSGRKWHFYENPCNKTPLEELWYPTYDTARKKGGGDISPQKRKQPNSSKREGQSGAHGNRENSNSASQIVKQQQKNSSTPQDQQTERSTVSIDVSVQTGSIRAVVNPANGPYVAESTAFRKKVKTVKQGVENDGKSRPAKEEPKTSKKQIASPKKKPPSNPKYNSSKSPKPEMSLRTGTNNPNMRDERMDPESPLSGKAVQCMLLKEVRIICTSVKDIPSQVVDMCTCVPKKDTISPGEAEDVSEAIVESIEEPAERDVAAPVTEDTVEESIPETSEKDEETTAEETATEEVPIEEAPTEEIPIEEAPMEEIPTQEAPIEEISVEEAPMEEALPEVTVSEVPETTEPDDSAVGVPEPIVEEEEEEEEAPPSTITAIPDLDEVDPTAPIELSREFDGKRTNVSVQMQTSNTILTQILSEFQVGNKKRQILMSIRVHSNLEGCDADEQPSNNPSSSNECLASVVTNQPTNTAEYSSGVVTPEAGLEINGPAERNDEIEYSVQVTSPRRQPSTRDGYDHRRRMRRPPESAYTHRRALTARDVHDSSMNPTFISRASYQRVQRTYLRRLYDTFIYTSDGVY